jgi:hypothetical protein
LDQSWLTRYDNRVVDSFERLMGYCFRFVELTGSLFFDPVCVNVASLIDLGDRVIEYLLADWGWLIWFLSFPSFFF